MEPLSDLLQAWLDELDPETSEGIRSRMDCAGDTTCDNCPTHFNSSGDGFCEFHWDFNQADQQEDLAA